MVSCLRLCFTLQLTGLALAVLAIFCVLNGYLPPEPEMPVIQAKWFGRGKRLPEDTKVKPFTINVDQKDIDDLKLRLDLDVKRLAKPLEGSAFNYGFNTDFLVDVAKYWKTKYDWKKEEKALNAFPHFKTQLDGIDLHFIHVKPAKTQGKVVLPLLIVHGWPGSVVEFAKIIPMLTTPRDGVDFVFEVIAPSIPGYGWSSAPAQMGFDEAQCARIFRRLMQERLGFQTFYTQGGDWGSLITSTLATLYPESVRGLHLNMATANTPSANLRQFLSAVLPEGLLVDKSETHKFLPLGPKFSELILEMGYLHLQATKPDTVGVALSNSPLGLAAYILEKFSTWTLKANRNATDGNLTQKFTLDELLTNVMVYWTTGSITSSMRFYAENLSFKEEDLALQRIPIRQVPTGIANFPQELALQPRVMLESKFKRIVTFTEMERGGHFAAFEEPKLLADDVWTFVKVVESLKKSGKNNQAKQDL